MKEELKRQNRLAQISNFEMEQERYGTELALDNFINHGIKNY